MEFLEAGPGVALPCIALAVLVWIVMWWLNRRDLRRWDERHAAYTREHELTRQLWEMEAQIREERLSEEEREWRRRYREEEAEVKREAQRLTDGWGTHGAGDGRAASNMDPGVLVMPQGALGPAGGPHR